MATPPKSRSRLHEHGLAPGNSATEKFDAHDCAATRRAEDRDMTAMPLDHLLHQVQTQSGSRRSRPQAMERLKHALALFWRYTRTIVLHLELRPEDADGHMASAMFDRILT